jgi:hypothetical protein
MLLFWRRKFSSRTATMLRRLGFIPRCLADGFVELFVNFERGYRVQIDQRGDFVRVTGHPELGFSPRNYPLRLLAELLIRNGELAAGSWRLASASEHIWLVFSYAIPIRHFDQRNLKLALENVVSEVHRMAVEYRHFQRV